MALLLMEARTERQPWPESEATLSTGLPACLARRLEEACTAWEAGQLPSSQVAQLQALGLSPFSPLTQSVVQRVTSHVAGPPSG